MKFRVTIDPVAGLVRVEYLAQPTVDDLIETMNGIFTDPTYRPGFGFLFDRRGVLEAPTTPYIRRVSEWLVEQLAKMKGSRLAVLVATPVSYGTSRMSGMLLDGSALQQSVFRDPDEALRWLALGRAGRT